MRLNKDIFFYLVYKSLRVGTLLLIVLYLYIIFIMGVAGHSVGSGIDILLVLGYSLLSFLLLVSIKLLKNNFIYNLSFRLFLLFFLIPSMYLEFGIIYYFIYESDLSLLDVISFVYSSIMLISSLCFIVISLKISTYKAMIKDKGTSK